MTMAGDPGWACAQTVSRFFRYLDENQPCAAAHLFVEDGVWIVRGAPCAGRDAIEAFVESRPKTRVSRHLVTNIIVDPDGDDMVARYYVLIFSHTAPFEGVPPLGNPVMILTCEDRLVNVAGDWLFVSRSSQTVFAR